MSNNWILCSGQAFASHWRWMASTAWSLDYTRNHLSGGSRILWKKHVITLWN